MYGVTDDFDLNVGLGSIKFTYPVGGDSLDEDLWHLSPSNNKKQNAGFQGA